MFRLEKGVNMIRIIYHGSDFDGHCGGAIARDYFENEAGKAYTMHSYNYGQPFPHEVFEKGDELYFIDVSFQPNDEMKEWKEKYGYDIYIIDHHKTVVESDILNYIVGGVLDVTKSGCELAWEYFYPNRKMPKVVELLGRYDVWDKSDIKMWKNLIMPFQFGFNLMDTNPCYDDAFMRTWDRIFYFEDWEMAQFIDEVVYKGKAIQRYQKGQNRKAVKGYSIPLQFCDKKAIVMNTTGRNSGIFDSIWNEDEYDLMLVYARSKYDIGVSLYTTKEGVDVSELAKLHGGGGHTQAAGFCAQDVEIKDGVISFIK